MRSLVVTALFGLLVLVISRLVVYIESRHRDYQLARERDGCAPQNQVATPSTARLPTAAQIKRHGRFWGVLMGLTRIVLSIPIAIFATLAAVPFWWLLESITGWHIVGHSGPDEWCYVLVYALVLIIYIGRLRSSQKTKDPAVGGGDASRPDGATDAG
jgi:hypothetical protein